MSKQQAKNELVNKHKTTPPPAVYQERASIVDSADIMVPRILLAQGLSQSVTAGKAKMGDFTNSMTGVVLGNENEPITFIPITMKKYWKKFEIVGKKRQFRGTELFTAATRSWPREEMKPSQANPAVEAKWENDLTIDVIGFTEDDVQDPIALPVAVSFTRTSYKTGQKFATHFASLDAAEGGQIPYHSYMMLLSCAKKQNDSGTFYTFDVNNKFEGKKVAKTPEKYLAKIDRWSKILNDNSRTVIIDEADDVEVASSSVDESRF